MYYTRGGGGVRPTELLHHFYLDHAPLPPTSTTLGASDNVEGVIIICTRYR